MLRFVRTMLIGAALLAPAALVADDHRDRQKESRYYDRNSRDWHDWNEREDKAYRKYLKEQRKQYRDFGKENRKRQQDYWKWRHRHSE